MMVIGLMDKEKEKVLTKIKMVRYMKAIFIWINFMVLENIFTKMEVFMKEISIITKNKEKVYSDGMMVDSMKGIFILVNNMGLVNTRVSL